MAELAINIEDEMKVSYLDYAMSVIIGRALPDVRDGLKPVQRRILYAMLKEGLLPNKKYSKCAGIVGEVLKKYHPHGDSAVYDALVRLAQDFNMRYPLVDGQGNFGSIDGDPPAAYRYTEARLTPMAQEMLADIEKETVDLTPNFDETTEEPTVLPSKIPNLIINGSSGIAVGMATSIPPHNLGEIVDALVMIIDNPDVTIEELSDVIKGPDFPTGGVIHGRQGIIDAYKTGRGLIKVRARVRIQQDKGESIIITELPYQVNKARLVEKIAELVREKKIEGISDIRDESDRDGIRVVLELKRGEMAQVALNQLYKYTQMESTFGIIMLSIVNGQPRVLDIKSHLWHFLQHRREVILRKTRYELRESQEKAHILEGLRIALQHLDEVISIIRKSKNPESALEGLIKTFPLTKTQAQAILDMKLQRLTGLEREKIIKDYKDTLKEVERLNAILTSDALVNNIIKQELIEIKQNYSDPRRTEISEETKEITIEDLIKEEKMVITISHQGYIKRNPLAIYRSQRRGGKGLMGMEGGEEDFAQHLFLAGTHDYLFFFTNRGRLYWLKVYQAPEVSRVAKGKAIVNILNIGEDEKITTVFPVTLNQIQGREKLYLFKATKKGIVKKTPLIAYSNPRSKGINAITLNPDDELIGVRVTDGKKDIILSTKKGLSIRFNEKDVREKGRVAHGVRGIRLAENDEVVSVDVLDEKTTLLTVTEKGYGKRTLSEEYRVQGRGGKGIITLKTTPKKGNIVGILEVTDEDEVIIIASSGKLIRLRASNIPTMGRHTQGVRLIDIGEEERVMSIARVVESGREEGH